ncbi:MAG: 4-hydroxy-tetrahydrodipicolinate reductase [Gemmatimonadaceae bacterium]|nr:4-hydroxy-tetrahydrodipicolinate reductase [Gemmatimonadaceae bacterium]
MTERRRIAIIGDGRMGRAVAALAAERGHAIVAMLGERENVGGVAIGSARLGNPDVAIEFTEPASALANVLACVRERIPVVVGTTGWYAGLPEVERLVADAAGAVFYSPNFSFGVALFLRIAGEAARAFRDMAEYDAHIVETHHKAKKDAPSGTAASLAAVASAGLGRAIGVTSVRVGSVPGTHELLFDAPFEQIRVAHEARDRRVFAAGAVRAAEWLVGRQGVFTMQDMLQLTLER